MARIGLKRGFQVGKVINRVIYVVLSIYIGAEVLTEISNVVNGTASPLYSGLTIIGWTVGAHVQNAGGNWSTACDHTAGTFTSTTTLGTSCVTNVNGDGILSVIGIVAIASLVLEFVSFRL